MNIAPTALTTTPRLKAAAPADPLRAATQELESVFLGQMLEAMRRTVPRGGALPASGGEEMFRAMLDQEVAQQISRTAHGLGIGEMLYRQLAAESPAGTEEPRR